MGRHIATTLPHGIPGFGMLNKFIAAQMASSSTRRPPLHPVNTVNDHDPLPDVAIHVCPRRCAGYTTSRSEHPILLSHSSCYGNFGCQSKCFCISHRSVSNSSLSANHPSLWRSVCLSSRKRVPYTELFLPRPTQSYAGQGWRSLISHIHRHRVHGHRILRDFWPARLSRGFIHQHE